MKTNDAAWLFIRSVGLLMLICSFYFTVRVTISGSMAYSYRKYKSLIVGSSRPIPKEKDASDYQNQRKQGMYGYHVAASVINGIWVIFFMGSGIYLLRGGQCVHNLITHIPDDAERVEQPSESSRGNQND